jgi:hypothetical protein
LGAKLADAESSNQRVVNDPYQDEFVAIAPYGLANPALERPLVNSSHDDHNKEAAATAISYPEVKQKGQQKCACQTETRGVQRSTCSATATASLLEAPTFTHSKARVGEALTELRQKAGV